MLEVMEDTPTRLKAPSDNQVTFPHSLPKPRNVVIGGVGGSGIAGDIIADYLKTKADEPINVCRSLQLPKYVNEETLFLAVSYSGETRETLNLLEQATRRKASVASVTSGGALLSTSIARKIPYLRVPANLPPRVALPELLFAVAFVMGKASLFDDMDRTINNASRSLALLIKSINPQQPTERNEAKLMAQGLHGKLPLLLGPEERVSVLRRFKNELNENSKMPAFLLTIPECYHDDVEGLKTLSNLCSVQPILLLTEGESEGQTTTRESLSALLNELKFNSTLTVQGQGSDLLSQLLTAITLGDYTSVYLAILRDIDPTVLTLIPRFRAAMNVG
jgi:glucose/mannose-6-phosphate isomerase